MIASYCLEQRPWSLNAERRGATHWAETRMRTAEWRQAFWALGLQQRIRFSSAVAIDVHVSMRHPVADTGACIGAVKAAVDGLVDARVLPGDTGEIVRSITLHAPIRCSKAERESVTVVVRSL